MGAVSEDQVIARQVRKATFGAYPNPILYRTMGRLWGQASGSGSPELPVLGRSVRAGPAAGSGPGWGRHRAVIRNNRKFCFY